MNLSPLEKKILEHVAKNQLVRKDELKTKLSIDVSALDTAMSSLANKKFITTVNPVGSTCYAITRNGAHFLQQMNE